MSYLLERLPSGSRIAVIRLRSLGDCVLTTPALRHTPRIAAFFDFIVEEIETLRPILTG